mmetsp:Transcript_195/g.504  ORF Transcript_195/g.504 Transcript_195/m.504 type:complete len:91 (+) Transcript_195:2704-2976(+)
MSSFAHNFASARMRRRAASNRSGRSGCGPFAWCIPKSSEDVTSKGRATSLTAAADTAHARCARDTLHFGLADVRPMPVPESHGLALARRA